jgi:drug/metabolite transporter (DMT)-like permease
MRQARLSGSCLGATHWFSSESSASSTAVIMIRLSHTHPTVLAALRLLIASTLLAPVFLRELRRNRAVYTREHWRTQPVAGRDARGALHFLGLRFAHDVRRQASLIANLVPIALPFFLHWLVGERINRTRSSAPVHRPRWRGAAHRAGPPARRAAISGAMSSASAP